MSDEPTFSCDANAVDSTRRLAQHCIDHHEKRVPALDPALVFQSVVEERADVNHLFQLPPTPAAFGLTRHVKETILHYVLLHGGVDCVMALLSSPLPIDFTVLNSKGIEALYLLPSRRKDEEELSRILEVVVERLPYQIDDRHGFCESVFNNRLFSEASKKKRFSLIWQKVKQWIPRDRVIQITQKASLEDFKNLSEQDHRGFLFRGGVEICQASTAALQQLFCDSLNPDPAVVAMHVQDYADVFVKLTGTKDCILDRALREGSVECVKAILETPLPLFYDFVFLAACERHSLEELKELLALLVSRLQPYPKQKSIVFFLRHAGACGLLSTVWPIVCGLAKTHNIIKSLFENGINLKAIWLHDWNKLSSLEEKHCFRLINNALIYRGNSATAALARLSCHRCPDPSLVEQYIRDGADVHFEWERYTIIARFMCAENAAAIVDGAVVLQNRVCTIASEKNCYILVPSSVLENRYDASVLMTQWLSIIDCSVESTSNISGKRPSTFWQTHQRRRYISNLLDLFISSIMPSTDNTNMVWAEFPIQFYSDAGASLGLLSLFWSKIKHFVSNNMRITLENRILLDDFMSLPSEDRSRFAFYAGVEDCVESTVKLLGLFNDSRNPDVDAVSKCVQAYGDILHRFPESYDSILSRALRESHVACIAALLETPLPIPVLSSLETVFERYCVEEIKAVLRLIVARLRTHPHELLSVAPLLRQSAKCGVLSDVWPILSELPHLLEEVHASYKSTIVLFSVWDYDWEKLLAMHHPLSLSSDAVRHSEDPFTAALARLSCSSTPDPAVVERCIRNGANVNLDWPLGPILTGFIVSGSVDALAAALKTEAPIDFTTIYSYSKTHYGERDPILHAICKVKDDAVAAAMLDLIVERLQTHPEDPYDFGMKDYDGDTCLTCAAKHDRLALFWSRLQDFPYYADNTGPIDINHSISWKDRELLGDDEIMLFKDTERLVNVQVEHDSMDFMLYRDVLFA